jgi:nitrate reductase cytochrome c-type subunit
VDADGDPQLITITKEAKLCGSCHIRGSADKIPASKGFIRHHEQYNELVASPHKNLKCITCHNPHLTGQRGIGIKTSCNSCHRKDAKAFEGSRHSQRRIKCESCHMAPAAKSAVALGKYEGDIKSHSMSINIDPNAKMFTDDGKFAKGYLTVEYSCLYCHPSETKQWALQHAKGVHKLGKK